MYRVEQLLENFVILITLSLMVLNTTFRPGNVTVLYWVKKGYLKFYRAP